MKRAGYAFRQIYQQFLFRYKMLAEETWPHWEGDPQEGVHFILTSQQIPEDEYAFGKTKIFIRNPKTVSINTLLIACLFHSIFIICLPEMIILAVSHLDVFDQFS